jgi:hypothetical protein
MAAVVKQDSNFTDLRYSVESAPGVAGTVWYPLEPNSYKNFGSEVKTKQRMPINSSRQLKKGVVVDLDAMAGFVQDLTPSNSEGIMQSFMYAESRDKDHQDVATVTGSSTDAYTIASGGLNFQANDLIAGKDFDDDGNNGLKRVASSTATTVTSATDLVTAATQTGAIERVGYQFDTGVASINVSGTLPTLVVSNTAAASTYTVGGGGNVIQDGNTLVIDGRTYTWQTILTNVDGNVLIGANDTAALLNMKNAINLGAGSGTAHAAATTANTSVSAVSSNATTLVINALVTGKVGNRIATTESSPGAWTGLTLAGGAGRDLTTLGLIQGEYLFIGGDATEEAFFNEVNLGYCRIREVLTGSISFDKTQFTMVADDGTSTGSGGTNNKTIQIFFGRVLKNESDSTLIVKRGLQFERQLGYIDDSTPSQIQAEYIVRALADDMKFDMKTADIIRLEFAFKANTAEERLAATGLKSGSRPTLEDTDAFNSTSDVVMTKICIVDPLDSCPDPLFSFFTDLSISLKNNVKQNKAVSVLGAFDSTPGFFQVAPEMTAYFVNVAEMTAIRDNETLTLETHLFKFNKGVSFDMPCLVASKAMPDVKINEPIMLPLSSDAAAGTAVDVGLNHTLLMIYWDYLPDLAGTLGD